MGDFLPLELPFAEVERGVPGKAFDSVDLPAPFGPIRPRMSPCASVMEAASTALKLPKAFVTWRASRSMGCSSGDCWLRGLVTLCPQPLDKHQNTSGLKARDQDDDRAVHDEGQP